MNQHFKPLTPKGKIRLLLPMQQELRDIIDRLDYLNDSDNEYLKQTVVDMENALENIERGAIVIQETVS